MAVWEAVRDAFSQAHGSGREWLTAGEAVHAVNVLAPDTSRGTIIAAVRFLCVNDPPKKHGPSEPYRRNPVFTTDDPEMHGKRYRLLTPGERVVFLGKPWSDLERFSYTQVLAWLGGAPLDEGGDPVDSDPNESTADPEIGGIALLELHLQDYLHRNWSGIFPELRLFEGEKGREFQTSDPSVGILDFLAVDAAGNFVIIETKRDAGDRRAVGQILSYMGWVKAKLCTADQSVRKILLIGAASNELRMAVAAVPNLSLKTYQISFALTDTPE